MAAQNEPNFALFTSSDLDFLKMEEWWNNWNPLFDGLTYNTSGHFAHCSHFKILRNSQNIRAYYMLNHRIKCIPV